MPVRRSGLALATVAIAGVYAVPLVSAQLGSAHPAGAGAAHATHATTVRSVALDAALDSRLAHPGGLRAF